MPGLLHHFLGFSSVQLRRWGLEFWDTLQLRGDSNREIGFVLFNSGTYSHWYFSGQHLWKAIDISLLPWYMIVLFAWLLLRNLWPWLQATVNEKFLFTTMINTHENNVVVVFFEPQTGCWTYKDNRSLRSFLYAAHLPPHIPSTGMINDPWSL